MDDDAELLTLLTVGLQVQGAQVHCCANAPALQQWLASKPTAIPAIVITGDTAMGGFAALGQLSLVSLLHKPVSMDDLTAQCVRSWALQTGHNARGLSE